MKERMIFAELDTPAPERSLGSRLDGGEPLPAGLHGPASPQAGAGPRAAALPAHGNGRWLSAQGRLRAGTRMRGTGTGRGLGEGPALALLRSCPLRRSA